jgi:hypothetical protein
MRLRVPKKSCQWINLCYDYEKNSQSNLNHLVVYSP